MTGFEPVFIDSVSFIYLVENHPEYSDRVSDFLIEEFSIKENTLITSVITISEFSIKPIRENDFKLLVDFQETVEHFHVTILDINQAVAHQAAKLRAKYHSLKTVDALQLASAIFYGCKRFLTNDTRLKSVSEIDIILIKNL